MGDLSKRIEILQQAEAQGKELRPEHQAELQRYREQGLAKGGNGDGKPMPAWAATPYEKQIGIYGSTSGALNSFKDDFAGNAVTGGLENTIQSKFSGFGTEGQRDWWAQFGSTDNVIRNDLFGAALTETEKASYAATTINPSMDPKEIRRNLESRREILRGAMQRRTNFLKAQGYSKEAIEALAGEYAQELGAALVAPETPPPPPSNEPPKKEVVGLAEGATQMIDQAAGLTEPGVRVNIGGGDNKLSPEARAELQRLLASDAPADEIRAFWEANGGGGSATPPANAGLATERGNDGLIENADAVVRGIADTATLGFADEIAAAGDTIFGDGTMAENLRRQRGVDRYDEENNPWMRGAGQLAGAIVPVGAGAIGTGARGAKEMALVGAGVGGAYGVGSGETLGERFTGGAKGAVAGATGGLVLGKLSDLYLNRMGGRTPPSGGGRAQEAAELSRASNDMDIPLMPADAAGPTTRMLTSVFGSTPGGVQPITSGARTVQRKAGEAMSKMAGREGPELTEEAAGQAVTQGALKYRSGSRTSIGRAYDRAAEMAGDARVQPKRALETLDRSIAELGEVPGGADGLKVLTELRDDLATRGTVTVQGIRGMRTQLRQKFMKEGLIGSDLERRVNEAVDAAGEDLVSSLMEQGKDDAAKAYIAADKDWADRIKTLDEVIMPIIGKKGEKSGEDVIKALNAAAKGNNARLGKLFDALPEEEAGAARAMLINQMGAANPGAQGAKGGEFSLDTFLIRWNQVGASAKNSIFRGENRKAIDQLALIAEKSKAAGRFRNFSNTSLSVMSAATGTTAIASIATLGKVLAGQYIGGRLLASPHVARALLGIAKAADPAAVRTRIAGLSEVATRDPTIRNEVIQLQQRLLSAVNDNAAKTGTVAASPDERPAQK